MIKEIDYKVIPHKEQRYDTCGDWWLEDTKLVIRVSEMGNWHYEVAVGIHEMIEALLCIVMGIKEEDVSAFDLQFEEDRKKGLHSEEDEPGDHPNAPYHIAHGFATAIERLLIAWFGESWEKYSDTVINLEYEE